MKPIIAPVDPRQQAFEKLSKFSPISSKRLLVPFEPKLDPNANPKAPNIEP